MSKKIGVILAGCGWLDGAEIQEAVATLLSIDQRGATAMNFAPNIEQMHVVDHLAGEPADGESRNVLLESARITRGEVTDVAQIKAEALDALIIPGGFGAAKNLSTFATAGADMTVNEHVRQIILDMHAAGKPIGFICIAPAIGAKVLGPDHQVTLTIGNDEGTAGAIEAMGAKHQNTEPGQICIDQSNKVVSTPAYMIGPNIGAVFAGIDALVEKVIELA